MGQLNGFAGVHVPDLRKEERVRESGRVRLDL